uniref:Docking protein 1b n=1 Tax=Xiphophorus couchianus TaxID=32473 RepID=A0A3B5L3K4_9TELE
MDAHVKEGQLYVQHQKFGKKWKKNWFVLYPASQNGIARLEFFDSPSGGGGSAGSLVSGSNEKTRKLDKKIIRLSECISILPALTESCPKDNMAAFCVETNDKTHVFAAEKNNAKDWMDTMCDIAFQVFLSLTDSNGGPQDLQMSENLIYYSREEVNEFWVTVQRTEASERCGLAGSYWLKAENEALIIKEPKTKRNILVWPYKLLRRYGRDRVMFSFEAGRRCDSGPGNFTFETKQGNEIFTLVDLAIQSQKAHAEERHLSGPQSLDPDCPLSLQYIRSADGDSGGSKPGSADGVLGKREGGDGVGRGQGGHKGRSLPEPPAPRGLAGKAVAPLDEQTSLYSEPADSVRLLVPSCDGLYSDPVDTIKGQNQTSPPVPTPRLRPVGDDSCGGDHHHTGSNQKKVPDLYSHFYDQIGVDLSQKTGALRASPPPAPSADHIYDEPEGCAKGSSRLPVSLGMTVYDEARLEPQRQQEELQKHSPKLLGLSRGMPQPPTPKFPKPATAPKPNKSAFARKEPVPLPAGKHAVSSSNVNNNNNMWSSRGGGKELYSRVSKQKPPPSVVWCNKNHQAPLRAPDIIYDNLGDI